MGTLRWAFWTDCGMPTRTWAETGRRLASLIPVERPFQVLVPKLPLARGRGARCPLGSLIRG